MWIKNFTASSMRDVLARIKDEMGANAVILDTRVENGLTSRSPGSGSRVTVTAASERPDGEVAAAPREGRLPVEPEGPKTLYLRGELAEGTAEMPVAEEPGELPVTPIDEESQSDIITRIGEIGKAVDNLTEAENRRSPVFPADRWLSVPDIQTWLDGQRHLKENLADAYAGHLLDQMPEPDAFLSRNRLPAVVCFIGPPGCGKSTVLMKSLALWWRTRKTALPVVEVAGEQSPTSGRLAGWANMFDLQQQRFQFKDTKSLSRYLSHTQSESVFVKCDLPPEGEGDARTTKKIVRALRAKIVVLVLSSLVRRDDNERFLNRYAGFSPTHLCLAHWDEAQPYDDARYLSAISQLPLAYHSLGPAPCGELESFTNADLRSGITSEIWGGAALPDKQLAE